MLLLSVLLLLLLIFVLLLLLLLLLGMLNIYYVTKQTLIFQNSRFFFYQVSWYHWRNSRGCRDLVEEMR